MTELNMGILGTSEIAFRRFLPALKKAGNWEYVGVASRTLQKTEKFVGQYGGRGYGSYDELIADQEVNAVYLPLPPSLHFEWARKALENGKHVFLEKPSAVCYKETENLVKLASEKGLALRENYMFTEHPQLQAIKDILRKGEIGELRLIRIAFGFPRRQGQDFRYNKALGGGSLLDCGGYTVKLASILLGTQVQCQYANLFQDNFSDVDLYGSAVIENEKKQVVQLSFGMDNAYKCEVEIWGQKGSVRSPRIFTAPADAMVKIEVEIAGNKEVREISANDQFYGSLMQFEKCINEPKTREKEYQELLLQARLMEQIFQMAE